MFLTGYIVAMVTCYVNKITVTCPPMFKPLLDIIIVVSNERVIVVIRESISAGK